MFRGREFLSVKWPLELWFSEGHPEKSTDGGGSGGREGTENSKATKRGRKAQFRGNSEVPGKPVREKERLIVRDHLIQGYFMDVPSGLEVPTKVVNLPEVSAGITECLFSCKRLPYWLVWDQSWEGPRNNLED